MVLYFNFIFWVLLVDPRKLKYLDELSLKNRGSGGSGGGGGR